jgi:hypothetical protein
MFEHSEAIPTLALNASIESEASIGLGKYEVGNAAKIDIDENGLRFLRQQWRHFGANLSTLARANMQIALYSTVKA